MQMLSSIEDKMKNEQPVGISPYIGARVALPGKSAAAAESVAVNLQDRPAVVSVATGATACTDPTDGCMYNGVLRSN